MNKIEYNPEFTTVWSFPDRGNWATHTAKYRGNFAPQIPRNIIEMYSKEGDTVLDPMIGGGTTAIEAKLLKRNLVASDINPNAIELTKNALKFNVQHPFSPTIKVSDARNLDYILNNSIDLIITHPPYLNIIAYSGKDLPQDISNISSLEKFCNEIRKIADELYRVLKPNKYCAILVGDTRKNKHYVPLAFSVMVKFLDAGFVLKEDIIKIQYNCRTTSRWKSKAIKDNFYLIMHEHLFVFRKPTTEESLTKIKSSTKMFLSQQMNRNAYKCTN